MSSQSETASVSSAPEHVRSSTDGDGDSDGDPPTLRAVQPDEEASASERPALELTQCPECGGREFISKLLVYEVTSYDEAGTQADRRLHVQAEFEFTCRTCQTILRTLPATRRDYYQDVQVLAADRQAALRAQLRTICGQVVRRLWAPTTQVALVLAVLVAVVLIGL